MLVIHYIYSYMLGMVNMDYSTLTEHLGGQIRQKRLYRGLTQVDVAAMAGITRQTVIAVEKGSLSSSINVYARVLAVLGCDLAVIPAEMPTLDEVGALFE
jgi:DNA-binding XRE family transcriptional regulator